MADDLPAREAADAAPPPAAPPQMWVCTVDSVLKRNSWHVSQHYANLDFLSESDTSEDAASTTAGTATVAAAAATAAAAAAAAAAAVVHRQKKQSPAQQQQQRFSWHSDRFIYQTTDSDSVVGGRHQASRRCETAPDGKGFSIASWGDRPVPASEMQVETAPAPNDAQTAAGGIAFAKKTDADQIYETELLSGKRIVSSLAENFIDVVVKELRGVTIFLLNSPMVYRAVLSCFQSSLPSSIGLAL